MAGLEALASIIYHEKQQPGSMLCAQHALNSLLQGNYFTAPDLSDIARNLDALEESYDDANFGHSSTNMDDTGFFSVQVLDNALKVWGLNLTRWRGEELRHYQDHPHTQLAFILNLEQHWFTLRRFGPASANIEMDSGDGHWFNLNSFLPAPEWVGKLYLGMVLQQAEADGYSVFAVTQADPAGPIALPRTEADEIASTLPEPRSANRPDVRTSTTLRADNSATASTSPEQHLNTEELEEEDYELQAALQASLMPSSDPTDTPLHPPPITAGTIPLPMFDSREPSAPGSGIQTPTEGFPNSLLLPQDMQFDSTARRSLDPVVASMERNRLMLERMRAEQEMAHRELWGADRTAFNARRREQEAAAQEEEESLRRAIEESQALAQVEGHGRPGGEYSDDDEEIGEVGMDIDTHPIARNPYPNTHALANNRVYDDDDAELQAALKASLEQMPAGWEPPELRGLPTVPAAVSSPGALSHIPSSSDRDREDVESILSDETHLTTSENTQSEAGQVDSVSVDELRRRRLARFGA